MARSRKRLISAVVAAVVAAVGVVAASALRSESPVPDGRAILVSIAIASVAGWYLTPRPGRPGFIYRLITDALIAAMAFALPAALAVVVDILVSGDAGLAKDPIGWLAGLVGGTGWVWVVIFAFASPFALIWALLLRLVPDDPRVAASG